MACLQPPWFSSLRVVSPAKLKAGPPSATNKPAKPLCWAVGPDNAESSEPDAPKPVPDGPVDPVKLAFSKAEAYKESIKPNSGLGTTQSAADNNDDNEAKKDLPDSVKIAMEKAKKYKQNKGVAAVSETTQGYLGVSDRSSGKNVMDNKASKDGDFLMNVGKLKEALPNYEKSELHGLAALQWSICQDSLSRSNETRGMYEKLKSHPNPKVSKKARQFMYSFQAMEMMKETTGSQFYLKNSDYQNYFDAFVENKSNYPEDGLVQESAMNQSSKQERILPVWTLDNFIRS
ncbi:hypothetical protein JHK87_032686 [Glycine soja]|nr:hypothetical protein JHK87_032686 [Glycine soja]